MANWNGYSAISMEAKRLGWPEICRSDLSKHDKGILAKKDAPEAFGWSIRQTGTDFYRPNSIEAIRWAQAMYRSGDQSQRYYWYDGTTLSAVSLDELLEQLCQTLDVNFYQQRFRAASIRAAELWKSHFYTIAERESYATAERERAQAERDHQEVVQLTSVKQ